MQSHNPSSENLNSTPNTMENNNNLKPSMHTENSTNKSQKSPRNLNALKRWLMLMGCAVMCLVSSMANAQVSNYSFSQTTGSYAPITGGTNLNGFTNFTNTVFIDDDGFSDGLVFSLHQPAQHANHVIVVAALNMNGFITLPFFSHRTHDADKP